MFLLRHLRDQIHICINISKVWKYNNSINPVNKGIEKFPEFWRMSHVISPRKIIYLECPNLGVEYINSSKSQNVSSPITDQAWYHCQYGNGNTLYIQFPYSIYFDINWWVGVISIQAFIVKSWYKRSAILMFIPWIWFFRSFALLFVMYV